MRSLLFPNLAFGFVSSAADVTFGTVRQGPGKPQPRTWQSRGNGIWRVIKDGALSGPWDLINQPEKQWFDSQKLFRDWLDQQAWIYTEADNSPPSTQPCRPPQTRADRSSIA